MRPNPAAHTHFPLLGSTPHPGIPSAPIPISAAIQLQTIVPSYRDNVDPNSRNQSERPRTLSTVKINKGPTAPNIGPKCMVLYAQSLVKSDAAPTLYAELSNNHTDTVIPRIIAGGDYYFLSTKRSRLFEGAIISNIVAHWRSFPKYFVLLFHSNRKLITSNKLGFLSVPNLVIWLIFNVNILGVRVWISFSWSGSTATWKGGD